MDMAELPRKICNYASTLVPKKMLFGSQIPVFLPFYHVVSDRPLAHILNYPYPTIQQFEKELDYLLKHFTPIELHQLKALKQPGKFFHLSFDDGLRQCAETIAPILLRKGIPATFFVNSAFVGNRQLFHRYKASLILNRIRKNKTHKAAQDFLKQNGITHQNLLHTLKAQENILDKAAELLEIDFQEYLKQEKPYLDVTQIKQLAQQGFSIGAHSIDHPEFELLPKQDQLQQVQQSMQWLNTVVPQKIKAFAFPYTDDGVSSGVLKEIHEQGWCDFSFGTAGVKDDTIPGHFQRFAMEQNSRLHQRIKGEFLYFHLRKRIDKHQVEH